MNIPECHHPMLIDGRDNKCPDCGVYCGVLSPPERVSRALTVLRAASHLYSAACASAASQVGAFVEALKDLKRRK